MSIIERTHIGEFVGRYRFLSNFWPVDIRYDLLVYPSVEHAFQAAKAANPVHRKRFIKDACRNCGQKLETHKILGTQIKCRHGIRSKTYKAVSPGDAKRMGRRLDLRVDWEDVKIGVMLELLRIKFENADLKRRLIDTGDAELVEGNTWNDTFWGVCFGKGNNHLGNLLMKVRAEISK